jgi:hypothetical protein
MFQKAGPGRVCFNCKEEEEMAYRAVRDFLELNPGADIPSVAKGTGLDEAFVLKLLQSGRLVTLGELTTGMQIACERCGQPTASGRYCAPCVDLLGQAFKNSVDALAERPDPSGRLRRPETMQEKRGRNLS